MTLYHLISDQVWQNLIPILALQPSCVVHVRSNEPKWRKVVTHLEAAVRLYPGLKVPEWVDAPIDSSFPDLLQVNARLDALAQRMPPGVFNFTGGTKLMAIAAHAFAMKHAVPSFYFDSRQPDVFSGNTGDLPRMADLRSVAARVSVSMALSAHGYDARNLRSSKPSDDLLEFARSSSLLRQQNKAAVSRWLKACREAARNQPPSALPRPDSGVAEDLAEGGCIAGILDVNHMGQFSWKLPAAEACQLLEGGWWELLVYDHLQRTGCYSDLLWGVDFADDDSRGETDLVGFNYKDLRLEIFSCKTERIDKPLEHVESLRNRAIEMGGNYSRPHLALFASPSTQHKQTVAKHCRTHRVSLLFGTHLENVL